MGRPLGGNVSDELFPKVLYAFFVSRGCESQLAIAKSLGKKNNSTVGMWLRGEGIPSSVEMANILEVYQPTADEVDMLVEAWCVLLQHRVQHGGGRRVKQSETPLGRWLEQFASDNKITLKNLSSEIGANVQGRGLRDNFGVEFIERIIGQAEALGLDEVKKAELVEACAQTIEEKAAGGHKFKANPHKARIAQKDLACTTYTPSQAADELGFTRQAIHVERNKQGLPLLMNEDQMEVLRQHFGVTRERQERILAGKRAKRVRS